MVSVFGRPGYVIRSFCYKILPPEFQLALSSSVIVQLIPVLTEERTSTVALGTNPTMAEYFSKGIMESVNMYAIINSKTLIHLQPSTHTESNIDSIKQKKLRSRRRFFPALYDSDYLRLTTRFWMQNAAKVGQLRNSSILVFCTCILFNQTWYSVSCKKVKLKAVCGSYSTDALRHIVLLPEWDPSFISRGAAHTKRRERPLLAMEGTIPGI